MHVLVAVASKHGSTLEIEQVIEAALRSSGLDVSLQRVQEVDGLDAYDAVVLGSGVYAGHWLREAREFLDRYEAELRQRPVWLFSSGPVGEPPTPMENPAEAFTTSKSIGARGHRLFAGKIDGSELRVVERALVTLVRAPQGDFRPWSEITQWAENIAADLQQPSAAHE